jgi:hypothetical protein
MPVLTLTPRTFGPLVSDYVGVESSGHVLLETTGALLAETGSGGLTVRPFLSFRILYCSASLPCSDSLPCAEGGLVPRSYYLNP